MEQSTAKKLSLSLVIVCVLCLAPPAAKANTLVFGLDYEFSGATPPASATLPWLTATFDDAVSPGTIRLTMTASNLSGSEFVRQWFFNFNPEKNPTQLVFTAVGTPGSVPESINTGTNAFQADGDGLFDIQFDFPTVPSQRFTTGESVTYDLSLDGLVLSDFDFFSTFQGGNGIFKSAAHVQGIGESGEGSGWIGTPVPGPAAMLLLASGLAGLAGFRWRSRRG